MKKLFFVLISLIILFSGCLLQPQVQIKTLTSEGDAVVVGLSTNKPVSAEIKILNDAGTILCSDKFNLKNGNQTVKLTCELTESEVTVSVFAEGTSFARKMNVEFGEGGLNQEILALAKTTFEGELIELYKTNLENSSECTAEKLVERTKKNLEQAAVNYPESFDYDFDLTQEELDVLDKQIKDIDRCDLYIERNISELNNNKYSVNYSLNVEGDCSSVQSGISFQEEEILIIEVDLADNSTEVTKGAMSNTSTSSGQEMQQQMIASFKLMGDCFKAMMLGVNPLNPESFTTSQDVCSSTEGNLEIVSFSIEPTYIVLQIKNNSDKEVKLTGFTGSPVPLTYINCCASIKVGETTAVNLSGKFSEKGIGSAISQKINMFYTLNGLDYEEVSDCTGTVEDTWGTYETEIKPITVEITEDNMAESYQNIEVTELFRKRNAVNKISIGELVPMQGDLFKVLNVDTDDLMKVHAYSLKQYRVIALTTSDLLKVESKEYIEELDVYKLVPVEDNLLRLELEPLDLGDLGLSKVILINADDLKTIGGNQVIDLDVYRIIFIANNLLRIKNNGLENELVISEMYKVTDLEFSSVDGGTGSANEEVIEIISSS